jgi:hypothetical protein
VNKNRSKLEELYEEELDAIVKEGMLFVLKIECDDMIPSPSICKCDS